MNHVGWIRSIAAFGLIGVICLAVNAAVYVSVTYAGGHYVLAWLAAWAVSVPLGYFLNRKFAFESTMKVSHSMPRVVGIYAAQQVLILLAIGALVDVFHFGQIVAYALTWPPAIAFSYLSMRWFGFR